MARQEAVAHQLGKLIGARSDLERLERMGNAEHLLIRADTADREAGIYRIKLDDELLDRMAVQAAQQFPDAVASEWLALTDRVLSVLRERAEQ